MIGILIMTHEVVGQAYKMLANHFFDEIPKNISILGVNSDEPLENISNRAKTIIEQLPQDGVLILTDVYGATPCNVARGLLNLSTPTIVLTGLNAAMLVKTLQYANQHTDLNQFAQLIKQAGQDGIILINKETAE